MGDSIRLRPEKGINPHLTCCSRCGKDTNEIALLGHANRVRTCLSCGIKVCGAGAHCPNCDASLYRADSRELRDSEKIPTGLCGECEKEIAEHKSIVAAGGIFWKCSSCGSEGVIKPEAPICAAVREKLNVPEGPCGIDFEGTERCPCCGGEG